MNKHEVKVLVQLRLSYHSNVVSNLPVIFCDKFHFDFIIILVLCYYFTEDERETTQTVHLLLVLRQLNLLLERN